MPIDSQTPPLVVGGLGFSGTRVVARIVRRSGRFMGTELNESDDALAFYDFAERWSHHAHAAWAAGAEFADRAAAADLTEAVTRHRRSIGAPGDPWGWKQPRSVHFLPFLRRVYPELRYVHVIRDGLDLSLGEEVPYRLEQGRRGNGVYSAAKTAIPAATNDPEAVQLMRLWAVVNTMAAEYGESELGSDYLRVRLEDLCERPAETVAHLAAFAAPPGLSKTSLAEAVAEITRPRSMGGAARHPDRGLVERARQAGQVPLSRFGYAGEALPAAGIPVPGVTP
jgi:hypothetical protein